MPIKTDTQQLGLSATPANNFGLLTDAAGGMKLQRGNVGAGTQDVMNVSAAGIVTYPQGIIQPNFKPGRRNRLDNGSCQNNSLGVATSGLASGSRPSDRWTFYNNLAPATAGFFATTGRAAGLPGEAITAMRITTGTGAALAAGAYALIGQNLEMLRVNDFIDGVTSENFTVSFWARTSIAAATYCLSMRSAGAARSYVTPVVFATTGWEYKSFTIPVDTASPSNWAGAVNTAGLSLILCPSVGATYIAPSINAWNTGNFYGITGQTQLTATTGATFDLTALQLERGPYATPLEFQSSDSIALDVMRQYELVNGTVSANNAKYTHWRYKIDKRVIPTISLWAGGLGSGATLDTGPGTQGFRAPAGAPATVDQDFTVYANAEV